MTTPSLRSETITPEKARKYLEYNRNNRPLSESTIKDYASAILSGEWELNGETIKFDVDGNLSDGQHRLHAVIVADTPIQSCVIRGISVKAFDTIDRGHVRTIAHIFAKNGEPNYACLSGAITMLDKYIKRKGRTLGGGRYKLSASSAVRLLEEHSQIRDSVTKTRSSKKLLPPSISIAFHYLCSTVSPQKSDLFFEQIGTGENLKKSDPAYLLRERLISNKKSNTSKLPQQFTAAITVKAWNNFYGGKKLVCLKWPEGEDFPQIAGCEF